MTKASLQKQTIFTLLFFSLFFLPNLLDAQNYTCKGLIEEVTNNYEAPPDIAIDPICEYITTIYTHSTKDCPTPESVTYAFYTDSVEINWEHDPLSTDTYRIDYINTTTGLSGNLTVTQPPAMIDNLDPGAYVFALRRICKKNELSDPVVFTGIIGPIIVDVIGALTAPEMPPICQCPAFVNQAPLINTTSNVITDFPWNGPQPDCVEKYNVTVKVNIQAVEYDMNFKIKKVFSGGEHKATLSQCYGNDDIELVPVNNSFVASDNILEGRNRTNGDLYFTIKIASQGIRLTPASSITSNSANSYTITIHSCCQLDDDNTHGGGGDDGDKKGGSNGGQEFNEEEGNSSARSSGIHKNEAMKAQLFSAPNPFTNATTINYTLPMDSELSLHLYNAIGQQVRELEHGFHPAGTYQTPLSSDDLQPGIYYLRLKTKTQDELIKMVKL